MRRADKRRLTAERITYEAQALTAARGLDGFTMEELALVAEVSRRTLFNYFPRKVDAVLGEWGELDDNARAQFSAGGPQGHLLSDLASLVGPTLDAHLVPESARRLSELARQSSRVAGAIQQRYTEFRDEVASMAACRPDAGSDGVSARLAVGVLSVVVESAVESLLLSDVPVRFSDAFERALVACRDLVREP